MTRWPSSMLAARALWLAVVALAVGCGESGPEKYEVTGMVTYNGQPIPFGDIIFEPKEGTKSGQTMWKSEIRDGRYTAEIVGGTHIVNIRDLTGDPDMDPEGEDAGLRPILRGEYRGDVNYPSIDQVDGSGPVEKDIEIPPLNR